jgi:hypothetical protein
MMYLVFMYISEPTINHGVNIEHRLLRKKIQFNNLFASGATERSGLLSEMQPLY